MLDRLIGNKVIGFKQCIRAMNNGKGILLYIANDAERKLIMELTKVANESGIDIKYIDSMKNLGSMCGIEVKTSTALMLD